MIVSWQYGHYQPSRGIFVPCGMVSLPVFACDDTVFARDEPVCCVLCYVVCCVMCVVVVLTNKYHLEVEIEWGGGHVPLVAIGLEHRLPLCALGSDMVPARGAGL